MTFPAYLWHPILVHFSIALLTMASAFYALTALRPKARLRVQWLTVAEWSLWVGVVLAVMTLLAGWLAFNTVEHNEVAHPAMQLHAAFALVTVTGFGLLALWSRWQRKAKRYPSWSFLALLLLSFGLLVATGLRGGELVYHYGLAVNVPTRSDAGDQSGHEHHQHDHKHAH